MTAAALRNQLLLAVLLAAGCGDVSLDSVDSVEGASLIANTTVSPTIPEVGAQTGELPVRDVEIVPPETTVIPEVSQPIKPLREPDCHYGPRGTKCWEPDPPTCEDPGCIERPFPRRYRGRPFDDQLATIVGEVQGDAARWVEYARAEHASVAAFARHALELMAFGAPMELLAEATQAQMDEVRHAELCLQVAKRLGGTVELGELDTSGAPARSLFDMLAGVASEGCVTEALSVWEMIGELEEEPDAATRAVLVELIEDEIRHASLAWKTLAWGLPQLDLVQQARIREILEDRPGGVDARAFDAVVGRVARALVA